MKKIARILPSLWALLTVSPLLAQQLREVPLVPPSATIPSATSQPSAAGIPSTSAAPLLPVPEADRLMKQAAQIVSQYRTIEAKLRQKVNLFDNQLDGTGAYAQQQGRGGELLLRLELKLVQQIDQRVMSFLQVCDGPNLWTYREQLDRATLTRVDMERIRKAWRQKDPFAHTGGIAQLGLGGVPRLVNGLDHSFRFTEIQEATLDERPVYRLRGGWEPHRLLALLPDQQRAIEAGQGVNLQRLPKHLPWCVEVYVGRDDCFPYRVSYYRPPASDEKRLAKGELLDIFAACAPICTVEFYEVSINTPLSGQPFAYQPGNLEIVDTTDKTLKQLDLSEPTK